MMIPLPPPYHGAGIQSKMIIASRLLNESYEIRKISISFADGIRDLGHFSWKKIVKMAGVFSRLLGEMMMHRPHLIYYIPTTRGISFYRDCLFIFSIRCFGIPVLFHHRLKLDRMILANPVRRRIRQWMFGGSFSIVLSPLLKKNLFSVVPEDKILVVPNGIPDVPFFQPAVNCEPPTVLYLSNMMREKGPLLLLEGLHRLKERHVRFRGYFAGEWGDDISPEFFFSKLREFGLSKMVSYIGPVYGEKKLEVISQSHVFVFPTFLRHETFGNVVLEAMRSGLPVVVSDEASLPFIVEDGVTGLIFKTRDSVSLAEKLEKLIVRRSLRYQMGRAGRIRYERMFTFEKAEKRLKGCFDRVLEYYEK